MLVYAFRAGRKGGTQTDAVSVSRLIEFCARYKDRWLDQDKWFLEDLPQGAKAFVETKLIVRRRTNSRFVVSHIFAKREKSEPDTVFIGAIEWKEYRDQSDVAVKGWRESQKRIRREIASQRAQTKETVRWKDLSPVLQSRCKGVNLTIKECWIWQPREHLTHKNRPDSERTGAPYRDFYTRIKGPIPTGVLLRHTCDNRMCINPNHLLLGTPRDNVRDMMKRERHASQVVKKNRKGWREAARRRKLAKSL